MPDSLTLFGTTYSNVAGFKAAASSSSTLTYIRPQGLLEITENSSNIDVSQYAIASVNVAGGGGGGTINLQDKTNINPTTSSQTITADNNYDGLNSVQINAIPSQYIIPAGTSVITTNGTGINIAAYASIDVAVPSPSLQTKNNIAPTENSQTITADTGYYGLSSVQINAISSTYIGTGVAQKSSSDLSVNGSTITAPAGYYSTAAQKSIAGGTAATPNTTITTSPTININSSGLITVTISSTSNITPTITTGYISSGTAGTITVSGSNTSQLSTQTATIITPSTAQQTAVTSGKYTTGNVVVAAIPSAYIIPSGTKTITANASGIDVTNYATVNIAVSNNGGIWQDENGRVHLSSSGANTVTSLSVTQNGTYTSQAGAYNPVIVNVSGGGSSDRVRVYLKLQNDNYTSNCLFMLYTSSSATSLISYNFSMLSTSSNTECYLPSSYNGKGYLFVAGKSSSYYPVVDLSQSTGVTLLGGTLIKCYLCDPDAVVVLYSDYVN